MMMVMVMVKWYSSSWEIRLRATERHLPYRIGISASDSTFDFWRYINIRLTLIDITATRHRRLKDLLPSTRFISSVYWFHSSTCIKGKAKARVLIALCGLQTHHRATERRLPYGITQCYLPPNTGERTPP